MSALLPCLLGILIGLLTPVRVVAQAARPYLQHIELRDQVLRQNVADFVRHSGSRWLTISVQFDSTDQSYLYHLSDVGYYEIARDYKGQNWGEWQHAMLFIYGTDPQQAGFSITNPTSKMHLQQYARLSLRRALIREPGTHTVRMNMLVDGGTEYTFKVINGQQVYFFDNLGHDDRLPLELPPVPESRR